MTTSVSEFGSAHWCYCDEMHLEIGQAWEPGVGSFVSAVDIADCQKKLKIDNNGFFAKAAPVVKIPVKQPAIHAIPAFPGNFGYINKT